MHHSRLCAIVIDCHVDELAPVADFWSQAPGKPIASVDQGGDGKYAELQTAADLRGAAAAQGIRAAPQPLGLTCRRRRADATARVGRVSRATSPAR